MTAVAPTALQYAVDQQALWSAVASRARRRIDFWRAVALVLGMTGAVAATLATQVDDGDLSRVLSIAAAVALAAVPLVLVRRTGTQALQGWTRMRSVSEGIKTEEYLYLTGTPPYDGDDADRRLLKKVETVTESVSDLIGETVDEDTPGKDPPEVNGIDTYVDRRVRQQIDEYYVPKGALARRRANAAREVLFTLALIGAALGAVAASIGSDDASTSIGAWVPVATTVAAAVAAQATGARYEETAVTYLQTARQLDHLIRNWELERAQGTPSPEADAELVRACEEVISVENQGWMARWNTPAET